MFKNLLLKVHYLKLILKCFESMSPWMALSMKYYSDVCLQCLKITPPHPCWWNTILNPSSNCLASESRRPFLSWHGPFKHPQLLPPLDPLATPWYKRINHGINQLEIVYLVFQLNGLSVYYNGFSISPPSSLACSQGWNPEGRGGHGSEGGARHQVIQGQGFTHSLKMCR